MLMGWIELQIQERIFEEFINRLRNNRQIPNSIIEGLSMLWQSPSDFSLDELMNLIEEGRTDGS
jgi:hypothetical protein